MLQNPSLAFPPIPSGLDPEPSLLASHCYSLSKAFLTPFTYPHQATVKMPQEKKKKEKKINLFHTYLLCWTFKIQFAQVQTVNNSTALQFISFRCTVRPVYSKTSSKSLLHWL